MQGTKKRSHPGKKALIFCINFPPEVTGVSPYNLGYSNFLIEEGFVVEVYTGIPHYPNWKVEESDKFLLLKQESLGKINVIRHRHFVPHKISIYSRILWDVTFFLSLLLTFFKSIKKVDLCLSVMPGFAPSIFGYIKSKLIGCPHVIIVQDLMSNANNVINEKQNGLLKSLIRNLQKFLLSKCVLIIVPTESFKEELTVNGVSNSKIHVIQNWSQIPSPKIPRFEFRSRMNWTENEFYVVHSGNIGQKQDMNNIIKAAKLLESYSDIKFVICGNGNQKDLFLRNAKDSKNIEYTPIVAENLFPDFLNSADVLLVSEYESSGEYSIPSKLTSYLHVGGAIVIATSLTSPAAKLIRSENNVGIVVPPANPNSLCEAILNCYNDSKFRQSLRNGSKEFALKTLNSSIAQERFGKLLHELNLKSDPH